MQNKILSLLVDNTSGVLSRIAGMFSRRGYNIDSITAGVTADVNYTRITVVCSGDDAILDQIVKQLAKLVDVRDIKVLDPSDSVVRETVLVKVAAAPEQRQGIVSIASAQTDNAGITLSNLKHGDHSVIMTSSDHSELDKISISLSEFPQCEVYFFISSHLFC